MISMSWSVSFLKSSPPKPPSGIHRLRYLVNVAADLPKFGPDLPELVRVRLGAHLLVERQPPQKFGFAHPGQGAFHLDGGGLVRGEMGLLFDAAFVFRGRPPAW